MKIKFVISFFIVGFLILASVAYAEKVCPVCGKHWPDSANNCGDDGTKLNKIQPKPKKKPATTNNASHAGQSGEDGTKLKKNEVAPKSDLNKHLKTSEDLVVERQMIEVEKEKLRQEKELFEQRKALEEEKRKLIEASERLEAKKKALEATANQPAVKKNSRFIDNSNGTVTDEKTGLMWASRDNGSNISWTDAKSYCENYRGGGHMDWRMPTGDEMRTLYDESKSRSVAASCERNYNIFVVTESINITCFYVWTSETRWFLVSSALYFDFYGGGKGKYRQASSLYTRALPVRNAR